MKTEKSIYDLKVTVLDLLQIVEFKEVKRAMDFFHSEKTGDYSRLFEQLKKFKKTKHKDTTEFITVEVGGFNRLSKDPDERWYNISTNKFSLSFRKWVELLNIPISDETKRHYRPEDIIALFIWEITFYGTETDATKIYKDMMKNVDEFEKDYVKKDNDRTTKTSK